MLSKFVVAGLLFLSSSAGAQIWQHDSPGFVRDGQIVIDGVEFDLNPTNPSINGQNASSPPIVMLQSSSGGPLELLPDGTACDAATENQVRFNAGTKQMEYCNGATWEEIGTGGSGGSSSTRYGLFMYTEGGPISPGQYQSASANFSGSSWTTVLDRTTPGKLSALVVNICRSGYSGSTGRLRLTVDGRQYQYEYTFSGSSPSSSCTGAIWSPHTFYGTANGGRRYPLDWGVVFDTLKIELRYTWTGSNPSHMSYYYTILDAYSP